MGKIIFTGQTKDKVYEWSVNSTIRLSPLIAFSSVKKPLGSSGIIG